MRTGSRLQPLWEATILAGTLNRRGVFLKKLAAFDLEFFGSQTVTLAERGQALAINSTIAEAVLPREARRRGMWTAPSRNFFGGDVEQLSLSRALDWQLSGITPERRPLLENDWFAVRYEVDDDGQIAFVWRTITRDTEQRLWAEIENNVARHLVSGMVHFSAEHPEHDAVDAIVFRVADATAQLREPVARAGSQGLLDLNDDPLIDPETPTIGTSTPAQLATQLAKHVILKLSGGEVAQYYESRIVTSASTASATEPLDEKENKEEFPATPSVSSEAQDRAGEADAPLDINTLLKIDETKSPILLDSDEQSAPAEAVREQIPIPAAKEIPSFLSEPSARSGP